VLRGAAETRASAIIAGLGYWAFGVPLGYMLAFRFSLGPIGVWIGLTGGLFVVALLLALRARHVLWHSPFSQLHAG
jgi:MATE family multidrug resistance protein